MKSFQILCATMYQKDFSLIKKMKITSDVLFANQCDKTDYRAIKHGNNNVEMISTCLRGSGNNRNISLMYATADICLLADDDVIYYPDYKDKILYAFERNPKADMIIFNLETDSTIRTLPKIKNNRKMHFWNRNPYGSVRVAFCLKSQRKYNIWFSNILGAGALYGSGEDSLFINDFRKKGNVYLCKDVLGKVDFSQSSWFNGYDEKFFFNHGAKIAALYDKYAYVFIIYYAFRYFTMSNVKLLNMIRLMKKGYYDYKNI